tara:strand:- start:239 stop:1039 length:801 start_codon:yes stop_codon:yes gene_type:complete
MSLFDMIFGKGQNKSVNNLEQEALNVSEVQNPDNYNQSQYLGQDSSIDPSIQPDNGVSNYIGLGRNQEEEAFGSSEESFSNPFAGEGGAYLESQLDRLGITDPAERERYITNIHKFSQNVRGMESDNNNQAINIPQHGSEASSAKGAYQFTDPSVGVALNRMGTSGYSNRQSAEAAGITPFSQDFIQGMDKDPRNWSPEQADSAFLANMFSQRGSDDVLNRIGQGEQGADWEAYSRFHHTNVDDATIDRGKGFFSGVDRNANSSYY